MAKWARGHRNIHPLARTHVAINTFHVSAGELPHVQGFCQAWPTIYVCDVDAALGVLSEVHVVNVPGISQFVEAVKQAWATATANIRSDDPIKHWPAPEYDIRQQCSVCGNGGFCQDAAKELAHDIACILKMTGELPETFEQAQANVLAWMAREDIRSGDSSQLCERYMQGLRVAA